MANRAVLNTPPPCQAGSSRPPSLDLLRLSVGDLALDFDPAKPHYLRRLAFKLDREQPIRQAGADHLNVVSKLEALFERAPLPQCRTHDPDRTPLRRPLLKIGVHEPGQVTAEPIAHFLLLLHRLLQHRAIVRRACRRC